jgi:glyoxalase family protein
LRVTGLHHVTCIGSHPQRNLDFYEGILGLRLVKKTVHFDHEDVYHLYYGDETGTPGTILTFFPFPNPIPAMRGSDSIQEVAFAVPPGSRDFWKTRLESHRVDTEFWVEEFGEPVLRFRDHDGQRLKLVAVPGAGHRSRWSGGPVPDACAIRGLQGVRLGVADVDAELDMLTGCLGMARHGQQGNLSRLVFAGTRHGDRHVDVEAMPDVAPAPRLPLEGAPAYAGTVNHVAFGTENEATQRAFRERLVHAGLTLTPVKDRLYFKSIYMIDPGGIRVEIATDECAGFAADETPDRLGEALRLPPWLEHLRPDYEARLPPVRHPPERSR